jgi:[glutamine synthetase] adenylyltransferase / [glutamine synthetase]-adenylyl-L-tyrosine phosphorylase
MPHLLGEIAFRNPARARAGFAEIASAVDAEVKSRIELLLAAAPDPDSALAYLGSLREQYPAEFSRWTQSPTGLQHLVAIFSYSRFLSDELLQSPRWVDDVLAITDLSRVRLTDEYIERLESFLRSRGGGEPASPEPLALALFRRKEILRILLRDVLGSGALSEVTEELSNLADGILQVAYRRIRADLERRFGSPINPAANAPCAFSVIALGKLGGRELNYSSDIDLMFVYSDNGETNGAQPVSNKEFFKKLSNQLTELLSTYTVEGLCYRVDLRLRPEGRLGEVCVSLDGAKTYYQARARDWELQMLIKARIAAGEPGPGRALLDAVEDRIYSSTLDFSAVEAMSATRDRIDERLAGKRGGQGPAALDVKLARGGIRDIEFLVQCLQRLHGGRVPWVRHGGTLLALARLHDKNLLSPAEYQRLASAYQFLRYLEHRLQLLDDRQTHTLPSDAAELDVLARRMPAGSIGAEPSREQLFQCLNAHLENVVDLYERMVHAQKPVYYSIPVDGPKAPEPTPTQNIPAPAAVEPEFGNLVRSLDETSPALAACIARSGLNRGLKSFEHFLERAAAEPESLRALEQNQDLCGRVLDIFETSPYLSEHLIRDPRLIGQVGAAGGAVPDYAGSVAGVKDQSELRRVFRREMVRIMSESICLRQPIFETLGRTSDLADSVVSAAYRMAVAQVTESHPPETAGYNAHDQLMAITLGRLGMREFDVASDADLIFMVPDEDMTEHHFWTRVAERTIEIITAYTGDGVMFAVDTRLRPNGREGPLVQPVAACKEYFARSAEAWEGIAWMKSRAVAGNMERATGFLNQIQEVDWRRYGQGGRSKKDLRQMRLRLEKEQGPANPLKAGRGGYYDIDFALMYLRLKGAGLFFKVLNTPERIDIIEKMGHLDRDDASFLQDAAAFFRSVDHALRLYSGHAEGSMPNGGVKLQAVQELVRRWTPDRLNDEPVRTKLRDIQRQTRELFDRLFA